jgi:hypothetical protein
VSSSFDRGPAVTLRECEGRVFRMSGRSERQVVFVAEDRVNHAAHFLMGIVTLGFWWIVWLYLAIHATRGRLVIESAHTLTASFSGLEREPQMEALSCLTPSRGDGGSREQRTTAYVVFISLFILVLTLSWVAWQKMGQSSTERGQQPPHSEGPR